MSGDVRRFYPTADQRGTWYWLVVVLSFGLLSCVPFFHAAWAMNDRRNLNLGTAFAVASIVGIAIMGSAPTDSTGTPTGWVSDVGVVLILGTLVAACVLLNPVRRQVYGGTAVSPRPPAGTSHAAVAQVEAARGKRHDARRLAERDPLMARELRIGRPDLPREFDDGGLVDLNSAPAEVIAQTCGLDLERAKGVVAARGELGGFSSVDESLVYAGIDGSPAEVIRDRAIVLPS